MQRTPQASILFASSGVFTVQHQTSLSMELNRAISSVSIIYDLSPHHPGRFLKSHQIDYLDRPD